jgi:Tol biopolymer transport system component
VILLFAALTLAFSYYRHQPGEVLAIRSFIPSPDKTSFKSAGLNAGPVAVSPDGRSLAFVAATEDGKALLWVRSLSSLSAQPLVGTDGASFPFWSPDSRSLAFFAEGKLKRIDAAGGPVFALCDAPEGRGGTWNRDAVIVFAPNNLGPLHRVSASGGTSSSITRLDEARGELAHRWPYFLPDSRHFLYLGANLAFNASVKDAIYVGSLDGGESKLALHAGSNAAFAHGYLLFVREPSLMAQPFDVTRLETTGDAFPIAEQVQYDVNSTRGVFSVSDNGILAYQTGAVESGSQLTWYDRGGNSLGSVGPLARYAGACLSPDGKRLVMDLPDAQSSNIDIWLMDVARGLRTRFTFDGGIDISPIWSPDGNRVVFASNRKGHLDLYQKASSGVGTEEMLLESELEKLPQDWSKDGRFLLYYNHSGPLSKADLWVLPLTGDRKPYPFSQTEFDESECKFSPDGRWVAYRSDESGKNEIYVAPFAGPGGKRQVSSAGGSQPRWRRDGNEIFFLAPDNKLMAAEVSGRTETLEILGVRPLFQTRATGPGYQYDVSADGQRFLINTEVDQKVSTPLTLVQNWTEGVRR